MGVLLRTGMSFLQEGRGREEVGQGREAKLNYVSKATGVYLISEDEGGKKYSMHANFTLLYQNWFSGFGV